MLLGIAHPTLQPQLCTFLQTLARFKRLMQSAAYIIRNLRLNSRIFLHRLGNVLGEPLQVVALKTKVC